MPIRRSQRANASRSGAINTQVAPVESPTLESPPENQQTPSSIIRDLQSRGVASKVSLALENLCKDQHAPEELSEDRQPAEGPAKDLPVGEVAQDLPAVASPSGDQPTTEGPSGDLKPAEGLTTASPTGEVPSKTPPAKEPSTTLPELKSSSEGQPTTEVQAGDRKTAEGPTTTQQVEKAPEDTPTSESLSNSQSTRVCPTTNLPEGEIPKKPTEISSQGESTAERPSEVLATKDLPITPTVKALPSSKELSDVLIANSDQEHQKGFPSNPPSSDTVKELSQRINHEVNGQKTEKSQKKLRFARSEQVIDLTFSPNPGKRARIIDLTDLTDSEEESKRCKSSPSPELKIAGGIYDFEHKRRRMGDTNLPDPTPSHSPQGSTKASDDEPNGRRKPYPRPRVTPRELNDYVGIEKGWLDPSLSRCRKINQNFATQTQHMTSLETVNAEIYQKVGQITANSLSRKRRLELGEELKTLEKKRRDLTATLSQAVCDVTMEAASMEEDLERWQAKENKFTNRIEKSR